MRLHDDEIRVLRFLYDRTPIDVSFDRAATILKKFRDRGFIDTDETLTARGRHMASKLPPIPEPEPVVEDEPAEPVEFTDEEE